MHLCVLRLRELSFTIFKNYDITDFNDLSRSWEFTWENNLEHALDARRTFFFFPPRKTILLTEKRKKNRFYHMKVNISANFMRNCL